MLNNSKINRITTGILVFFLIMGISLMLYPAVSDYWNSQRQSYAIASYEQSINNLAQQEYDDILNKAREYNQKLSGVYMPLINYDTIAGYDDILNVNGNGIIGYITIPSIQIQLPIYHGTDTSVLNSGAGHLQGSSFPVGGANTHAVISAHRGLPSSKLFSDLDKLYVGDTFTITVLNEIYTYEVEEILIVEPYQTEQLNLIKGGDYVTLMTCTPYGINTHRLLIRSKRVENSIFDTKVKVTSDAMQIDPLMVMPVVAAPMLIILFIKWISDGKRHKPLSQSEIIETAEKFINHDK